jgi:very-short-patch-repair endonuclease
MEYNKELTPLAKALRKEMTRQERHLWYDFLRYYPVKVYKQKVIGNYIVDFYCHSAKLVFEIDGSQHYLDEGAVRDDKRTRYINSLGIEVIRFSNSDVDKNFDGVCEMIDLKIKEKIDGG